MIRVLALVAAIATAVTAVATCKKEMTSTNSGAEAPPSVNVVVHPAPPQVTPAPPTPFSEIPPKHPEPSAAPPPSEVDGSPTHSGQEVLSPSKEVAPSVIASLQELKMLNKTLITGDNGVSAELRLHDARERVRLANYIAQNSSLLEQLASKNPDILEALAEARRLPVYQAELESLSRR